MEEKEGSKPEGTGAGEAPVTFAVLLSGLMMDALVALGDMEHPMTKKKEPNLDHARFSIGMLELLQEKTKNNLTKGEAEMLEGLLYDLRMRFVSKKG